VLLGLDEVAAAPQITNNHDMYFNNCYMILYPKTHTARPVLKISACSIGMVIMMVMSRCIYE
jgi:hypothetical protein